MNHSINQMVSNLYELCGSHDWTYEYSDDFRVWQRGKESERQINLIASLLTKMGHKAEVDEVITKFKR